MPVGECGSCDYKKKKRKKFIALIHMTDFCICPEYPGFNFILWSFKHNFTVYDLMQSISHLHCCQNCRISIRIRVEDSFAPIW